MDDCEWCGDQMMWNGWDSRNKQTVWLCGDCADEFLEAKQNG